MCVRWRDSSIPLGERMSEVGGSGCFFRSGFQLTNLKQTEAPGPVVRGLLRLRMGNIP